MSSISFTHGGTPLTVEFRSDVVKGKTALALLDTPNLFRSAIERYGSDVQLDYGLFREWTESLGAARCEAIVNDGVSPRFTAWLKRLRYVVTPSHARDVDEMLISRAVLLHRRFDSVVIGSGDGKNCELIRLFRRIGIFTAVAAVPGSIHRELAEVADATVAFPIRRVGRPAVALICDAA